MLAALEASGESDRAFARRTGVAPHRICYWRKKLEGAPASRNERTVAGFVPVRVVEERPPQAPAPRAPRQVEALLPSGARLVFRGEWDRASLRPWLASLGASDAE
jgi:hypothetical protein